MARAKQPFLWGIALVQGISITEIFKCQFALSQALIFFLVSFKWLFQKQDFLEMIEMTIGEKIKFMRIHRNMTQRYLGNALNYSLAHGAKRISQYEHDVRTPKKETVARMLSIMGVSEYSLLHNDSNQVIRLIENFFWLETMFNVSTVNNEYLFLNTCDKCNDDFLSTILAEIKQKQQAFASCEITKEQYIDFKLNWPESSMYYAEIIKGG